MDKKRAEGKHFYVYTVAGSAKFLRIYYAKVKEYLNALEETAWYETTMAMLLRSTAIIICTGHILPGLQPEYGAGPLAMPISYPVLLFFCAWHTLAGLHVND